MHPPRRKDDCAGIFSALPAARLGSNPAPTDRILLLPVMFAHLIN
jgi:hypothetical protein